MTDIEAGRRAVEIWGSRGRAWKGVHPNEECYYVGRFESFGTHSLINATIYHAGSWEQAFRCAGYPPESKPVAYFGALTPPHGWECR